MSETLIAAALIGAGIALLFIRLSALERRLDRLCRLEGKVDALLGHQGISFDPLRDVPPDVQDALHQGQRILAIKRLREATGLGLKEAKEAVDEMRRRARAR